MEETKLVKVYSNQSKKARLKRNKNKFQRIWDAEKKTYVKVRKAKYPVHIKNVKKDWRTVDNSVSIKRRQETPKKPKSVPVNTKSEIKKEANKKPARVNGKVANVVSFNMCGIKHVWDTQTNRYKRAA